MLGHGLWPAVAGMAYLAGAVRHEVGISPAYSLPACSTCRAPFTLVIQLGENKPGSTDGRGNHAPSGVGPPGGVHLV